MFSPLRQVKPNAFHLNHSSSHLVLVTCLNLWRADGHGRGIPPAPFNESSYRFKSHDPTDPPATLSPFLCLASRHVVRCSPDTTAVGSPSSSAFVSVSQPIRSRRGPHLELARSSSRRLLCLCIGERMTEVVKFGALAHLGAPLNATFGTGRIRSTSREEGAWPKKRPAWHFQPTDGEPHWTDREARPEFGSCISRASRGKCVTASCHLCLVIFTSCHVICCWFIARRPLLSNMEAEPNLAQPRS